jgi:hypothetical protein
LIIVLQNHVFLGSKYVKKIKEFVISHGGWAAGTLGEALENIRMRFWEK